MPKVLYSVLSIVVAFAVSQVFSAPNCPPDDGSGIVVFFPDPLNCSRYYICVSGFPISQECPFPTVWDPTINGCNNPGAYACEVTTTASPPPTTTVNPTTMAPITVSVSTATPSTTPATTKATSTTTKKPFRQQKLRRNMSRQLKAFGLPL